MATSLLKRHQVLRWRVVWPPPLKAVSLRRRDGHRDGRRERQVGEVLYRGLVLLRTPNETCHSTDVAHHARAARPQQGHPRGCLAERRVDDHPGERPPLLRGELPIDEAEDDAVRSQEATFRATTRTLVFRGQEAWQGGLVSQDNGLRH